MTTASERQTGPKKTILFLDHTAQMGGGEVALFNLVTALDRERFTPVVLLASDGPLVKRFRGPGVETHLLPLDPSVVGARKGGLGASSLLRIAQAARLVGYVWHLARWARGRRVDLIHTNSLKADIYGGLAGRLARVPVLWHINDHIDGEYLPPHVAAAFRLLARTLPSRVTSRTAHQGRSRRLRSPLVRCPRAHHRAAPPAQAVSAGRKRVRQQFTVARTFDHIQVLYDQILRTAES